MEAVNALICFIAFELGVSVMADLADWAAPVGLLPPRSLELPDALKWRAFDQSLAEACGAFDDLPADALESLLDEAVSAAREGHLPAGA